MRYGKRQRASAASTPSSSSTAPTRSTESAEATARSSRGIESAWWVRQPERYEYELAELDAARIEYSIDEGARAEGILRLDLNIPNEEGEPLKLQATFPDLYPYFRFEIRAPEIDLPHHQNPFSKNLCLLGRSTRHWNTGDTLAKFICDRVPLVLMAGKSSGTAAVAALEEHQGEPFSDYYPYPDGSMIMVDSSWQIPEHYTGGTLLVGMSRQQRRDSKFLGITLKVQDRHREDIVIAEPELFWLCPQPLSFRWIRLNAPLRTEDPGEFLKQLIEVDRNLARPHWSTIGNSRYDIIGCLFPEEQRYRETGMGWVFLVRSIPIGGSGKGSQAFFVRAGRGGKDDLMQRIPELRPLAEKKVAVFGTGGLGGPSSIELARSGVGELRILDQDFTDPSTVVRWPLGFTAAGRVKVCNVQEFIGLNYPYTKVTAFLHRLGSCRTSGKNVSDFAILDQMLDGVDLVYDATAELGINHLLSDVAAERNLPYVCVSVTPGAWGGRLIRIRPGITPGCWMCHQCMIDRRELPVPASNPDGEVQPVGCADPTFTGAGFDVASVAFDGVRLVASTLLGGSYPEVDWDIAIVDFRNQDGQFIGPKWQFFTLQRHPECPNVKAHRDNSVGSPKSFGTAS